MSLTKMLRGNRKFKDRLFRLLYSDKKKLLELYNALNGSNYEKEEDLEITTLDDVLYMKMKNDVSILLDDELCLWEHQSTVSPNLPLRGLLYFCELFRQVVAEENLYKSKIVKLPTPSYIIFYNGNEDIGEQKVLKLSDAFIHGNAQSKMELEALMLNINYGHNRELMEKSKTLREYAIFVDKVKKYTKTLELGEGIERAIDECIQEDVLRDFLVKRRAEVINSILTEYDEERVLADLKKESYDDGIQEGIRVLVESLEELQVSKENIVETVVEKFNLSFETATEFVNQYWKEE